MKIIHFYNFITLILFPLYLLVLLIRVMKKKDNLQSIMQRICFNMKERPSGELIWIHAASVGESMMAITLIENLSKERLQANYLKTRNNYPPKGGHIAGRPVT